MSVSVPGRDLPTGRGTRRPQSFAWEMIQPLTRNDTQGKALFHVSHLRTSSATPCIDSCVGCFLTCSFSWTHTVIAIVFSRPWCTTRRDCWATFTATFFSEQASRTR